MTTKSKPKTKEELKASARKYQDSLEKDVDELVDKAKTILTGTVVIGAGFWVAYKLFKALFSSDDEEDERESDHEVSHKPSVFSVVKQAILKEIAIFLLGILKEKVAEYLQGINADDEDS